MYSYHYCRQATKKFEEVVRACFNSLSRFNFSSTQPRKYDVNIYTHNTLKKPSLTINLIKFPKEIHTNKRKKSITYAMFVSKYFAFSIPLSIRVKELQGIPFSVRYRGFQNIRSREVLQLKVQMRSYGKETIE